MKGMQHYKELKNTDKKWR